MATIGVGFERVSLPERIAERILQDIRSRRLRRGDGLPSVRELVIAMGVSRPSMREALRALAMMNVIGKRQCAGTYVSSLETGRLIAH